MKLWHVFYNGTSNTVTPYPIQASGPKRAKEIAIAAAGLNPLVINRLRATKVA